MHTSDCGLCEFERRRNMENVLNIRYVCDVRFGVDKELSNDECLEISRRAINEVDKILKDMGIPAEHNQTSGVCLEK